MSKDFTIIDKDYKAWIQELGHRYHQSQILYNQVVENLPQAVENFREQIECEVFVLPCGHHRYIVDKYKGDVEKTVFYKHQSMDVAVMRFLTSSVVKYDKKYKQREKENNNAAWSHS